MEGGPLLWILPLYRHVNQKSEDDDDDDDDEDDNQKSDDDDDKIISKCLCPIQI